MSPTKRGAAKKKRVASRGPAKQATKRGAARNASKPKKAVRRAAQRARAAGTKAPRSTVKPRRTRAANSRRARAASAQPAARTASARPAAKSGKRLAQPKLVSLPRRRAGAARAKKKALASPFPATEGASAKQRLILDLVRARVAVQGALQGLQPPTVEHRPASGTWTVRDHALHLCHWDAEVSRALESALHGIPPSWADFADDETDTFNHAGIDGLRQLSWDDVRRLLLSSRMALMEALESISEEPNEPWQPSHPLGAMLKDLAENDRHHADIIKRWRLERGV